MNEKYTKELQEYLTSEEYVEANDAGCGSEAIAQHFYEFALAQVKEELEVQDEKYRIMRVSRESTIQQAREADLVVHVLHGLNNFVDRIGKKR